MLKIINLKEFQPTVNYAVALVEIEIENAKREGVTCLKVLHGYGSHGKGGAILIELRQVLRQLIKQGKIIDFFGGDKWNMFDDKTKFVLERDKTIALDEDMNKANPGITIIII